MHYLFLNNFKDYISWVNENNLFNNINVMDLEIIVFFVF